MVAHCAEPDVPRRGGLRRLRGGLARLKGDRYLRRDEDSPADSAFDKLTRETIWKVVTPAGGGI